MNLQFFGGRGGSLGGGGGAEYQSYKKTNMDDIMSEIASISGSDAQKQYAANILSSAMREIDDMAYTRIDHPSLTAATKNDYAKAARQTKKDIFDKAKSMNAGQVINGMNGRFGAPSAKGVARILFDANMKKLGYVSKGDGTLSWKK